MGDEGRTSSTVTITGDRPVARAVGLDFGTATTLIVDRVGTADPSSVPLGNNPGGWLPSLIGVTAEGAWVVGEDAEHLPETQVVRSLKSAISADRDWLEFWDGTRRLQAVSVDDAVARVLYDVRSEVLSREPSFFDDAGVRMACPAIWTDEQRDRLARIARGVGLDVRPEEIIDEPIAAGLGFLRHRRQLGFSHPSGSLVVVDVGGGTTDVAILEVGGEPGAPKLRTLMVHGTGQAGNAMDRAIFDHLRESHELVPAWLDPHESDLRRALLLQAARVLKEELGSSDEQQVMRPLLGTHQTVTLTRAELDHAVAPVVREIASTVWQTVAALRQTDESDSVAIREAVTHVQLAGGGSRVPMVRRALTRLFPNAEVDVDPLLRFPEASVATGLSYL